MLIYVVIASNFTPNFPEQDRCEIQPGIWLVRSDHLTSAEIAKSLNFGTEMPGIVIGVKNLGGFAESRIVDKISEWER